MIKTLNTQIISDHLSDYFEKTSSAQLSQSSKRLSIAENKSVEQLSLAEIRKKLVLFMVLVLVLLLIWILILHMFKFLDQFIFV